MRIGGILVFFHCRTNTGYAIGRLEPIFLEMAERLTGDRQKTHFGYTSIDGGMPEFLPENFENIIQLNTADSSKRGLDALSDFVRTKKIEVAFGFDQPVARPAYRVMRKAGIRLIVSYWGAPMSSINSGPKLLMKKLEVLLRRNKPDHFIFESNACAETAVYGRGIPSANVSVIPLGVNTEIFKINLNHESYAHRKFSIPLDRKIIVYSGHMEKRKGVDVIIHAANELVLKRKRKDLHFLLLGNRNSDELKFDPLYKDKESAAFITFGGYVDDVQYIFPSCHLGVIASTGWDSFTMSSLEMAASGLPLIVSNLQGLKETIDIGRTGFLFNVGDFMQLSSGIELLLNDLSQQKEMGLAARERIVEKFSEQHQIIRLTNLVSELYSRRC